MTGRKPDSIWQFFDRIVIPGRKGTRASCRKCKQTMEGQTSRMKIHYKKCSTPMESASSDSDDVQQVPQEGDCASDAIMEDVSEQQSDQRSSVGSSNPSVNASNSNTALGSILSPTTSSVNRGVNASSSTLKRSWSLPSNIESPANVKMQQMNKNIPASSAKKQKGTGKAIQMERFVMKTSDSEKQKLDLQLGRFMFATNTSFRAVEHPQFTKYVHMLRPGYKPPSRKQIGSAILDQVHNEEMTQCKNILRGQTVGMDLDGWSNLHNESIVCASIVCECSGSYLVKTIDTSGKPHDTAYLTSLAKETILEVEKEFGVHVRSFVTDNAANMRAMRKELKADCNCKVITYGCSSHLANLLAHDLDIPNVKSHVVQVVKHVRNTHLAAAKYKAAGGKKLILPVETRWNSVSDCLESYLKNWPVLASITLEPTIAKKIVDMNIKQNAEELSKRLKPIAVALQKLQSDQCKISDAVFIWKELLKQLESISIDEQELAKAHKRYDQAVTEAHVLAFLLDPRYQHCIISEDEESKAMLLAEQEFPNLLSVIVNLKAKSSPFDKSYLFEQSLLTNVSPCSWWRALKGKVDQEALDDIEGILTAPASSASVERVFSSFGLVHSKLRNRLGNVKAGKLVFLHKVLNAGLAADDDSEQLD